MTDYSIDYVAGFLFNEELDRVALIRKNKPEWQAGKYNGIGGKVEVDEDAHDAMSREFREETGVTVPEWTRLCALKKDEEWLVHFYWAIGDLSKLKSTTDEQVECFYVYELNELNVIPNLRWLIPMAIDAAKNGEICSTTVIKHK